jgi:hypothetical protein
MLANPNEPPIKVRQTKSIVRQEAVFVSLWLLTAIACGKSNGIAMMRLDMIYGFRPWSRGNGQRKKDGRARARKQPVFPCTAT